MNKERKYLYLSKHKNTDTMNLTFSSTLKTIRKVSESLIVVAAVSVSCTVDHRYDFDQIIDVDTEVTLFEKGIEIPVGSTPKISFSELASLAGDVFTESLHENEDGSYVIDYNDTLVISDIMSGIDLGEMLNAEGVNISESYTYHLGVDKDRLSVEGGDFSQSINLGLSDIFMPTLSLLNQFTPISLGLDEKAPDFQSDFGKELGTTSFSENLYTPTVPATLIDGMEMDLSGKISSFNVRNIAVDVYGKTEVSGVRSVSEITLRPGAKVVVKAYLKNCLLKKGTIVPDINIDLGQILFLDGAPSSIINLSELVLTESNSFSASQSYPISSLLLKNEDNVVIVDGTVTGSGTINVSNPISTGLLVRQCAEAGGMDFVVEVSFDDMEIQNARVEITPLTATPEPMVIDLVMGSTKLPKQVEKINKAYFSEDSKLTLSITAENLEKVPGLNIEFDEVKVSFPKELEIEGYPEGIIKMSGELPLTKEIVVKSMVLPDPEDGVQSFKGKITVSASAKASGRVNTQDLPRTADDDVTIKPSISGTLLFSDYSLTTKKIEENIALNKSVSYNVEGLGNLGKCVIYPKGKTEIVIDINKPDTDKFKFTAIGQGLEIKLPDGIHADPNGITPTLPYDENSGRIYIKGELPSKIVIPISKVILEPKEGAAVEGYMDVNGTVSAEGATVGRADIEALAAADMGVKVTIPRIEAESISLENALSVVVDKQKDFVIIGDGKAPEMLEYITEVKLKDVWANCSVSVEGLPTLKDGGKYDIDLIAELPEYVSPSSIAIKGNLDSQGSFKLSPVKIDRMHDISLAGLENLVGTLKIYGTISATDPDVDASTLSSDVVAHVDIKIGDKDGNITFENVKGRCNYKYDYNGCLSLNGLEALRKDEICLDVENPTLSLDIMTNVSVPLRGDMHIIPFKNGAASSEGMTLKDFTLNYNDDPSEYVSTRLEVNGPELARIVRDIPDSIKFIINANVDNSKDCIIVPGTNYDCIVTYDFNIPLSFGEDLRITASNTMEMSDDITGVLSMANVGFKAVVTNTIPLAVRLRVEFVDAEGKVLNIGDEELVTDIEPGKTDGTAQTSECRIVVESKDGQNTDEIAGVKLSFELSARESVSVSKEDYVQADLSAFLPQGITFDPLK